MALTACDRPLAVKIKIALGFWTEYSEQKKTKNLEISWKFRKIYEKKI